MRRHRSLQLLLLLWWTTWVFVILPCHTRGAISIGGCADCSTADPAPLFFGSVDRACCVNKSTPISTAPIPRKSSSNCAICQLAATTAGTPAIPPLTLTLRLLALLPPPTPDDAVHHLFLTTCRSRAPPTAPVS